MRKFVMLLVCAMLAGVAIPLFWVYGNLANGYSWYTLYILVFGETHTWLLLLPGMPMASLLGYILHIRHEKKEQTADRVNLALQMAILKNQEERLEPLLNKRGIRAAEKNLRAREAKVAEDEVYIAKAKGWERDLKDSRETSKRYREEIAELKKRLEKIEKQG